MRGTGRKRSRKKYFPSLDDVTDARENYKRYTRILNFIPMSRTFFIEVTHFAHVP